MDILMPIVFIIMFFLIAGVVIYLVYDYMEYKENVDSSFATSTDHVNDNFTKLSENIDIAETNVTNKINKTNGDLKEVDTKADFIDNKLDNTQASLDKFKSTYKKNLQDINNNFAITRHNDTYLDNSIQTNKASFDRFKQGYKQNVIDINKNFKITENNDRILHTAIQNNRTSLGDFDSALKRYFKFQENGESLSNKKIFEHVFSGVNPNLELLSEVHTTSGMTIKTPIDKIHQNNLKICNSQDNCIHMNVDNNGFNITPDNVNGLTINSKQNKPLAKFDLQNESIYFGGTDVNAPMFMQNSNVFMNNLNLIVKPPGTIYNSTSTKGLNVARISGEDLYEIGTGIQQGIALLQSQLQANQSRINTAYDTYNSLMEPKTLNSILNSINECFVKYTLNRDDSDASISILSILMTNIRNDLAKDDKIEFNIPVQDIGELTADYNTNYVFSAPDNTIINNTSSTIIKSGQTLVKCSIIFAKSVPAEVPVFFSIRGKFLQSPSSITTPLYGMTIGKRV